MNEATARKEIIELLEEADLDKMEKSLTTNEWLIRALVLKMMSYYHKGGIAALDTAIARIGQ